VPQPFWGPGTALSVRLALGHDAVDEFSDVPEDGIELRSLGST
jgi:hypothetical protein